MSYSWWEWAFLATSAALTAAYHAVWRRSRISEYQSRVLPVWAYIHEQSCKQSILMIQLMRNMMAIVTGLSAVMLGLLMALVRMDAEGRMGELVAVSAACAIGFVLFVFCASIIANLTFNMALYPADLSREIDPSVVAANRALTRHQLAMLTRHFGLAKRVSFITLQSLFVLVHPAALFVATGASLYMWFHMDTRLGVRLGGVDLSLLACGVPKSVVDAANREAAAPPAGVSSPAADGAAQPSASVAVPDVSAPIPQSAEAPTAASRE